LIYAIVKKNFYPKSKNSIQLHFKLHKSI